MAEAIVLGEFILEKRNSADFTALFGDRCSKGFDVQKDLVRFGVVNQTTMLASDTQAIADYLKQIVIEKYKLDDASVGLHFADTRDTLCYATNDNQTAVKSLLNINADLAIVIGGRNSSNSSHLVELCEAHMPTYFIESASDLLSDRELKAFNWRTHEEYFKSDFLPNKSVVDILITSGASCPDAIVQDTIEKLSGFFTNSKTIEDICKDWI
jgi:4-hydroxy-3-methylbut-2-enyl diphosphate reductase